jgi:acetyl-CoA acetyltransferase
MKEAFVCDAVRTPFGRYGGTLATTRADDLAAIPIRALIVAPRIMGFAPAPASRKILEKTGLKISNIDFIELNESFAAQALAVTRSWVTR